MSTPAFTDTVQIGIVMRDLEVAIRHYIDDYGIGPWEHFEFKDHELREQGPDGAP